MRGFLILFVLEAPEHRRDRFIDSYFRKAKPNQIVVIIKAREPARIVIAIGGAKWGCVANYGFSPYCSRCNVAEGR